MSRSRLPPPSLLVVAAFSRHADALSWGEEALTTQHGPIAFVSEDFNFQQTTYYEKTMGPGLKKRFLVFESLVAPESLADIKLSTIKLEQQLAATGRFPQERPLNLDPGLLQLGKFMLATTKDQAHRIYLRDGIFAEVTLRFHQGEYELWPWTYRDYQEPEVRTFLKRARNYYEAQLRGRRQDLRPPSIGEFEG